jgi:hypothetical protein
MLSNNSTRIGSVIVLRLPQPVPHAMTPQPAVQLGNELHRVRVALV